MADACASNAPCCWAATPSAASCADADFGNAWTFNVQCMPSSKLPDKVSLRSGAVKPCSANRLCARSTAVDSAALRPAFCAALPSAPRPAAKAIANSAIAASTSIRVKPRALFMALIHRHRAGQPIHVDAHAAMPVDEHDVAATGTAVRKIADARDAGLLRILGRRRDPQGRTARPRARFAPRRGEG